MRTLAAVALSLVLTAPVLAQDKSAATAKDDSASGGATAPRPSFRRDVSASQALFERLDKNKDGYLTGAELTTGEATTANWIAVDRDADGRISRAEFTAVEGNNEVATRRP